MRPIAILAMIVASTGAATAVAEVPLTCAQNESTFKMMCYANNGVRANGEVREAKLYSGGPKSIAETTYTARVHCVSGVLELTDRSGVAFARNIPAEQVGKDFVKFLCAHPKIKQDPKLKTN